MRILIYLGITIAALAALVICDDCGVTLRVLAADEATQTPPDLVLDFMGASRGFVEPCGCVTGQYGGIARWATYLKQSRKENPAELALFAGGARANKGQVYDEQASALWKGYGLMGFNAATLSSEDLPDAESMPDAAKSALVLANVVRRDGTQIAPPVRYIPVTLRSGNKATVAVIGLLGSSPFGTTPNPDSSPVDSPWKVDSPVTALRGLMPEVRKKADVVVVLYSGTRTPARQLARDVPGVDVMIVGLEGNVDHSVEKVGDTALVQNPDRGRFAAHLGITLGTDKRPVDYKLSVVPMSSKLPDDADMAKIVEEYRSRLTVPVPSTTRPLASAVNSEWAGSAVCATCHAAEYHQWMTTKHSRAMVSLERKDGGQAARRIDCVPCHVVAYNQPGGYDIDLPREELRGVGCESCHGPGTAHVKARQLKLPDDSKLTRVPAKALCITCHNRDNSPNFDFRTYSKRISHTAVAAQPTSSVTP